MGGALARWPSGKRRFVVVFLRGAVDGLNVVVPHGEPANYDARPTIAVGAPARRRRARPRRTFRAASRARGDEAIWKDGTLAFVHACGSPDPTRSHSTRRITWRAAPPASRPRRMDGSIARSPLPGTPSPTEALSLGPTMPRILSGKMPVANMPLGRAAARPMPLDRPVIEVAFDRMYIGNDSISRAYRDGTRRAATDVRTQQDMTEANAGAPSPQGFSDDTDRLAN